VPALGAPVVDGVANSFARKNLGEAIGRGTVFPRAGAGDEVDIAGSKLFVIPGIGEIGEVVDRIVEIEIVVVHPIHEISEVVNARHGEAALEDVGMLKEDVGGVISAEGRAHRGNRDAGLAVVPDEGDDFLAQVGVENGLHVTAMEGMSALVVEAQAINGIDCEELDAARVNEIGEGANHALALEFPFIAGTGRKAHEWRSPMAVDDDTEFDAQTGRMPAMVFALHL